MWIEGPVVARFDDFHRLHGVCEIHGALALQMVDILDDIGIISLPVM